MALARASNRSKLIIRKALKTPNYIKEMASDKPRFTLGLIPDKPPLALGWASENHNWR